MMNRVSLLGHPVAVLVRGGAARSNRKSGRRAVWLLSASSRIFPDIPTCFFAASVPNLHSQVVENQRSDFLRSCFGPAGFAQVLSVDTPEPETYRLPPVALAPAAMKPPLTAHGPGKEVNLS